MWCTSRENKNELTTHDSGLRTQDSRSIPEQRPKTQLGNDTKIYTLN